MAVATLHVLFDPAEPLPDFLTTPLSSSPT